MKKTALITTLVIASTLILSAQSAIKDFALRTTSTPTVVVDTLHYYLNKYYFKTGNTSYTTYPFLKTDASAVSSFTDISMCGSRFDVPAGDTVLVTGLEVFVSKQQGTGAQGIPIHIYLYKLDPNSGLPMLPIIDSVVTSIGSTGGIPMPRIVGGNFTSTITLQKWKMGSSFAVMAKNYSGLTGDFTGFLRTPCKTETNTAAPLDEKYGEGYGLIRFNGQFYSTKNFNGFPGFGAGTDFEFMVAPRVTYTIQAGQILPSGVTENGTVAADTMCARTDLMFKNTSSPFYEHRQYNLLQFYRKWNLGSPFPQSVRSVFSGDSSIAWSFEFYDVESPARDPRVFLPYVNTQTINAVTGNAIYPDCYTANQFRARLKPMSPFGRGTQLGYNEDFTTCFRFCNDDGVGIRSIAGFPDLKMYPNPAIEGKTTLYGLEGKTTVTIYSSVGQVISKETVEKNSFEINFAKHPKGTYLVKLVNESGQTKTVKIINN